MIDVNVSLGCWPFQRFAISTAAELTEHLRGEGITQAWVSAMESVLYPDPDIYDDLLFEQLADIDMLRPVKTVNPTLPNWRESLERAGHAIKLYPNYHKYRLDDDRVMALCETDRIVMIHMRIDDERNQSSLLQVPGVHPHELIALAQRRPDTTFVALCAYRAEAIELATCAPNILVDLSFVELLDTVKNLLEQVSAEQVLFGSHTPMLYTRSAVLKWQLADVSERIKQQIAHGNAQRMQ